MATIDNLTLEIQADSTKAVTALNNLASALGKLKSNLPTEAKLLNTSKGFKTLAEEISKLSLSAKNLDKIKAIGKIANSFAKFNTINPKKIATTADNLNSLQGAMVNVSYQSIEKIERLAKALTLLSSSNAQLKGIGNIKKTAKAVQEITPLTSGMSEKGEPSGMSSIEKEAGEASEAVGGFWTKYQTIQGLIKSKPISILASSEDTEKMSKLATTLGTTTGVITTFSKALGYAGIAMSAVSVATKVLKKAFEVIISPIKKAINTVTTFVRALARIALYRAIRGLLKSITQGLKEGIQNLALYSKALEGLDAHNANNVLSRYASEFLYFKNAVATAVIPVLRALIPYVETAINTIIKFVNVLAQVGSAIFGTEYTKAKYFWVDYADSLDNASGRAKALHHQLAGFDELNNLTAPSGGSGSDKLKDAIDMFEEALIDPKIKDWVDGVVNKIKSGIQSIKTATQPSVDKLKEFFSEFKTKVYPNIKRIYENLKKLWNDVLKPILDEFVKGFIKGFSGQSLENVADSFATITDKVADFTDWLVKLKEKIPMDKVKDFAYQLGEGAGKIMGWYRPITLIVTGLKNLKDKVSETAKNIANELVIKTEKAQDAFNVLKVITGYLYDKFIDLEEPTSMLSVTIQTLKDKVQEVKDKFTEAREKLSEFKDKAETAKEKFDDLKTKTSELWNNLKDLKDILFSTGGQFTDIKEQAKAFWEKLKDVWDKVKEVKTSFVDLKSYLDQNNPFKRLEDNSQTIKDRLDGIKTVMEWLSKLGKIAIEFTFKIAGADAFKSGLQSIGETLGLTDLVQGVKDKLSDFKDTDYSGKDTNQERAKVTKTKHQLRAEKVKQGIPLTPSDFDNLGEYQVYLRTGSYAKGGFPTTGQLFVAREAGAEMVGSINGKTAVANNDQITEAIAQATYSAMSKALSENNGNITIVVEGDSDKMFKVFQKKQRDYQRSTGVAY